MAIGKANKDPDAVLPYRIDWSAWLAGAAISTSTWVVPSGLTKVSDSIVDAITVVTISGGTAGQTFTITNRITTDDGRTDDRSFELFIKEL